METLDRGEFVRLAYRLGNAHATGVLTVHAESGRARGDTETLVLRRGQLLASDTDALGRRTAQRLARLAGAERARWRFDGGESVVPPAPAGATRPFSLALWARRHLEGQIDSSRAQRLVGQLAGVRLALRAELAPDAALCDDTDRRILDAMRVPRRLDQIWPLARTPRFRLLTFLHFLREVGAVELSGVGAPAPGPAIDAGAGAARRALGLDDRADRDAVKRAYRRLARALHPDLHPGASDDRRRLLAHKFAEISAAYRQLVQAE